ncbi:MAG: ribulose-phosphate 3-epimerase [Clostridia bacterium]|jgi:ribulose-phosphate 3-epimerase|nr:ribulose-phosphate 3-epimerase [Clostridia bacterium]MEE0789722.1 ribulose-phosphate 3-epimerase [Clostridia bacterium]HJJ08771.1 ribulose-phosphate 3-epimerase [Clostridiaceae bacterium]
MVEVSASILNMDNENAIKNLYELETALIDYFHIDVMDGKFVKDNTTEKMIEYSEYISSISSLPLDIHLMVEDVEQYIKSFSVFEPNLITFHIEARKNKEEIFELIKLVKESNSRVGLAIKPNTKIEEIYNYLPYIHSVLIMTVEPGLGGQELIPETIEKISRMKKYLEQEKLEVDIQADGGINLQNIDLLKQAGVSNVVVGNALMKTKDKKDMINKLKN